MSKQEYGMLAELPRTTMSNAGKGTSELEKKRVPEFRVANGSSGLTGLCIYIGGDPLEEVRIDLTLFYIFIIRYYYFK